MTNRYIGITHDGKDFGPIRTREWLSFTFGFMAARYKKYRNMTLDEFIADKINAGEIRPLRRYERPIIRSIFDT